MKTLKKVPLEYVEVLFIPGHMEFGVFYHSPHYKASNHLCVCGCGQETPMPIREGEWQLTVDNGKLSVTPSILQRNGCKSHYIITNGVANIV